MHKNLHKKKWEIILLAIIFLSLGFALGEAWSRHRVETGNRSTEILVEYGELLEQVYRRGQGHFSINEALQTFQRSGAGGVLFKEQTLEDLARLGELQVVSGAQLRAASRNGTLDGCLPGLTGLDSFNPYHLYVVIADSALWERVFFHLQQKIPGTVLHRAPGAGEAGGGTAAGAGPAPAAGILSVPLKEEKLSETGVGFPAAAVGEVAAAGMNVYLQLYGWAGDGESVAAVLASLEGLPGVRGILFQSPDLPGLSGNIPRLAAELERLDAPVVSIDLFEQQRRPLLSLVRSSSQKKVIRLHAISQEERDLLSRERALGRYLLAVSERNNRLLLVRYEGNNLSGEPWLEENAAFISELKERLAAAGHPPGEVRPYTGTSFPFSRQKLLFICTGILAAGALLLTRLGLQRLSIPAAAAGLLLVFILLLWGGRISGLDGIDLVRKGMALAAGVIFPLLGLEFFRGFFGERSPGRAFFALLGLSAFSLAGALLANGLLTDLTYIVKLDQLQGIRLALVLPLPLAWFLLFMDDEISLQGVAGKLRALVDRPVITGSVVVAVLLLIAAIIILSRSGNESLFVSELELRARFFLDRLLTVRPRTKEFLIGHPLMLAALYFGYRGRTRLPLAIAGMIGQVSLVNTFYHLHTPLAVSLLRTAGGLALGTILGFVLILVVKLLPEAEVRRQ